MARRQMRRRTRQPIQNGDVGASVQVMVRIHRGRREDPGTRKGFAELLKRRGFHHDRTGTAGTRIWRGLRLKLPGYDD